MIAAGFWHSPQPVLTRYPFGFALEVDKPGNRYHYTELKAIACSVAWTANLLCPLQPLGLTNVLFREFENRIEPPQTQPPQYLWAVGGDAAQIRVGQTVSDRYQVVAPQIWLDTLTDCEPNFPEDITDDHLPYLRLASLALHVPQIYGTCPHPNGEDSPSILLLENAPINGEGQRYPSLAQTWVETPPVRQVYWLWQILQLWPVLSEEGVAASLLDPENLRVQGWRVWLSEVKSGNTTPSLADLAYHWSSWMAAAPDVVAQPMRRICQQMRDGESLPSIELPLNQLLLELAAERPLSLEVIGDTDPGPARSHNEDACYPTDQDSADFDTDLPNLAILCDGVGGHEGGEVASQTTVQLLKLQVRELEKSLQQESQALPPSLMREQLAAIVRVANNSIAQQNDTQEREARQRMGTTLVLGWQVRQPVRNPAGVVRPNARELYLVHVGDSRAYWLTRNYCQQLTVDDDVATREVRFGRSFYREALQRMDAGALTQAVGTRDSEFLHPSIQRFIVEEDGILLLCSDGLSDNDWVEKTWMQVSPGVLDGDRTPEEAIHALIQLANEENGHDNTSVVMMVCRVSPPPRKPPEAFDPSQSREGEAATSEMSDASKALLYGQAVDIDPEAARRRRRRPTARPLQLAAGALLLVLLGLGVFWLAYQQMRSPLPEAPSPRPESPE